VGSRRRPSAPDSLELLLDTICNTFGGVLFMAILIAVLIRTSGKLVQTSPSPTSQPKRSAADLLKARSELTRALAEQDALIAATRAQRDIVKKFASPEVKRELQNRNDRDARKQALQQKFAEAVEQLGDTEARIEEAEQDLATLAAKTKDAAIELAAAQKELQEEIESRTQASKLPRLRPSTKEEIPLVLRFGRLYVWHEYDARGNRVGINRQDMAVVGDPAAEELELVPKPFAGLPIVAGDQIQRLVTARLSQFLPESAYLAIVVYPDSFDDFQLLKKICVEAGYEYRLMPVIPGETITDHGGRGGMVQ
jgi:hypothetical protein